MATTLPLSASVCQKIFLEESIMWWWVHLLLHPNTNVRRFPPGIRFEVSFPDQLLIKGVPGLATSP